jgi:hypothetical protein
MIVIQIIVSLIGLILLMLWSIFLSKSCLILIIPFIIFYIITCNIFSYSRVKKICYAEVYFDKKSWIYWLCTRQTIVFIGAILSSAILTSILVISTAFFVVSDYIILAINSLFIILIYNFLNNRTFFNSIIKEDFIKNISTYCVSAIFSIVIVFISLNQLPPDYIQPSLVDTINIASNQIHSNCAYIDYVLRLTNEIVAVKWWVMYDITININGVLPKWCIYIMWTIYFLGSFYMLLAYNKLIIQLLSFSRKFNNEKL